MSVKLLVGLAAASMLLATATTSRAETIWGKVETGMTWQQVKAMYNKKAEPAGTYLYTNGWDNKEWKFKLCPTDQPKCIQELVFGFDERSGVVRALEVNPFASQPEDTLAALKERFGEPTSDRMVNVHEAAISNPLFHMEATNQDWRHVTWETPELTVRLEALPSERLHKVFYTVKATAVPNGVKPVL